MVKNNINNEQIVRFITFETNESMCDLDGIRMELFQTSDLHLYESVLIETYLEIQQVNNDFDPCNWSQYGIV